MCRVCGNKGKKKVLKRLVRSLLLNNIDMTNISNHYDFYF